MARIDDVGEDFLSLQACLDAIKSFVHFLQESDSMCHDEM